MTKERIYKDQKETRYREKLAERLTEFPGFVGEYIYAQVAHGLAPRTAYGYLTDLQVFFFYLKEKRDQVITDTVQLYRLAPSVYDEYIVFLERYARGGRIYTNGREAKNRKLIALRNLYSFLYARGYFPSDISSRINLIRQRRNNPKDIKNLPPSRLQDVLRIASTQEGLPKHSGKKNRLRDTAILTLLIYTGIRVDECVGLDLEHYLPKERMILIYPKGYASDSKPERMGIIQKCCEALDAYILNERKPSETDPHAMFISGKKERMSESAMERMIRKYFTAAGIDPKYTPHSLRRTYGTALYEATNHDLVAVARRLHHKSVTTTEQRYIGSEEHKVSDIDPYK